MGFNDQHWSLLILQFSEKKMGFRITLKIKYGISNFLIRHIEMGLSATLISNPHKQMGFRTIFDSNSP